MKPARYAIVLVALLGAGCSKSLQLGKMPAPGTAAVGIPYSLYLTQFKIDTTYRLNECGAKAVIEVGSEVTETRQAPDATHTYLIDPNSLAGLFRTSKVEVKYHPDGSVSTINAEGEDRTAEAVVGLAKTAASIVKLAATAGAGGTALAPEVCSENALEALASYTKQKDALKKLTADLAYAQLAYDKAKARIDAAGAAADAALRGQYSDAFRALTTLADQLAVGKKALARLAEPLTLTRTIYWPTMANEMTKTVDVALADIKPGYDIWLAVPDSGPAQPADLKPYTVVATIEKIGANSLMTPDPAKEASGNDVQGIPYRFPQPGRLTIVLPFDGDGRDKPTTLFEKDYRFAQLGRILQLPCVVPAFSKGSCSAEFAADGQPTRLGTSRDKAPGEAVATMFAGVAEQAIGANDALVAARDRRAGAAKKAQEAELASLELQAKIRDAKAALVISPPGDPSEKQLRADKLAELQMDLQLILAQRALDEARATNP